MKNETAVLNLLTLRWRNHSIDTGNANTAKSLGRASAAGCVLVALSAVGSTYTTLTITLNAHRLKVGDFVELSAAVDGGAVSLDYLNGNFAVDSVPDANTFRVIVKKVAYSGAGTITVGFRCMAQRAIVYAGAGNGAAVSVGADSNADHYPIAAGNYYLLKMPGGAKFDLADVFVMSANANQSVNVMYV